MNSLPFLVCLLALAKEMLLSKAAIKARCSAGRSYLELVSSEDLELEPVPQEVCRLRKTLWSSSTHVKMDSENPRRTQQNNK